MNKKGFTLIELMVVVVIIGILAAVAVPKLFGMIAKSKASEVGPAAGTYVKMQQAYISEAVAIGNWTIIGYKGPGTASTTGSETTNFIYEDVGNAWTGNTTELSESSSALSWGATNKAKLNDCDKGQHWTVTVAGSSTNAGEATFTTAVKTTDCEVLTPTFKSIDGDN